MWAFAASTSGSTPTTLMTLAYSEQARSRFQLNGTTQKFLQLPDASACQTSTVSRPWLFSPVWPRAFSRLSGGAGAAPSSIGAFRIDHDEKFNQTTHLQYEIGKQGLWLGFNWRYDSGLVAGAVPVGDGVNPVDLSALSPDQQFQAGLFCNGVRATPTVGLPSSCAASQYGSTLISIPAVGTENDDKNPPRIAPRHLFDLSVGDESCFAAISTSGTFS
jgi:hypothetical protein